VAILLHLPLGLFGALELGDFGLAVIELRHRTKVNQICVLVHHQKLKARKVHVPPEKKKKKGSYSTILHRFWPSYEGPVKWSPAVSWGEHPPLTCFEGSPPALRR
jgi:hypothetical protein